MIQPSLIVFDLDFTLWDCGGTWCDCLSPPFRFRHGIITDRLGRQVRLYEQVNLILDQCEDMGVQLAIASRTEQPNWAQEILQLLQITGRFEFAEIYPTSKLKHFAALKRASRFNYEQMLFFDDESRNITEVSRLGVTSIHVRDGLNLKLFRDALHSFATSCKASRRPT